MLPYVIMIQQHRKIQQLLKKEYLETTSFGDLLIGYILFQHFSD